MRSVLISIQPKWCESIASGEKKIEIRKSEPKQLKPPFKAFIYCTQGKGDCLWRWNGVWYDTQDPNHRPNRLDGKVIGEFICDRITEYQGEFWDDETYESIQKVVHTEDWDGYPETETYHVAENGEPNYLCDESCLTWEELRQYVGQGINTFYGWHISELKIYDKPKELKEFVGLRKTKFGYEPIKITRPPQSWMYVEVEG